MQHVSIRQARTFRAACKHSRITGAAKAINRSQTSVTKSLQDLERELDVELFERSSKGVTLTAYGKALKAGASQASAVFQSAGRHVAPLIMQSSLSVARFFKMAVSEKWLDTFLAIFEHRNVPGTARYARPKLLRTTRPHKSHAIPASPASCPDGSRLESTARWRTYSARAR
jgi:hypothetical protein